MKRENSEMETIPKCPECGTVWPDEKTCQDHFHQMLFWEHEYPEYGEVHHLMVLSYYLQHPSLYSPEGLKYGRQLLADFIEGGVTPQQVRQRDRAQVASSKRQWKVKGTAASHGSYDPPIPWTMTAATVITGGVSSYCDNVRSWAGSIHELLKRS